MQPKKLLFLRHQLLSELRQMLQKMGKKALKAGVVGEGRQLVKKKVAEGVAKKIVSGLGTVLGVVFALLTDLSSS